MLPSIRLPEPLQAIPAATVLPVPFEVQTFERMLHAPDTEIPAPTLLLAEQLTMELPVVLANPAPVLEKDWHCTMTVPPTCDSMPFPAFCDAMHSRTVPPLPTSIPCCPFDDATQDSINELPKPMMP
jgi:hypothetical protein